MSKLAGAGNLENYLRIDVDLHCFYMLQNFFYADLTCLSVLLSQMRMISLFSELYEVFWPSRGCTDSCSQSLLRSQSVVCSYVSPQKMLSARLSVQSYLLSLQCAPHPCASYRSISWHMFSFLIYVSLSLPFCLSVYVINAHVSSYILTNTRFFFPFTLVDATGHERKLA